MITHLAVKKRLVAKIQHGGDRHLKSTQTDDFLAIFNQLSTHLVVMLQL